MATRIGMTDSILDGETGILVEPSDPRSLAGGILRILRDPFGPRNTGPPEESGCLESLRCEELLRTSRAFIRASAAGGQWVSPAAIRIRFLAGSFLCLLIVARYVDRFLFSATLGSGVAIIAEGEFAFRLTAGLCGDEVATGLCVMGLFGWRRKRRARAVVA